MTTNHSAAAREWMDKQCHIPAFDEIPDDDPTMLSLALAFERVALEAKIEMCNIVRGDYELAPRYLLYRLTGRVMTLRAQLATLAAKEDRDHVTGD